MFLKKILNSRLILFTLLFISVALSSWISTAINPQNDELRALANIYLPYFVGLATLLGLGIVSAWRPTKKTFSVALTLAIVLNIMTGITLNIGFTYDNNYSITGASAVNSVSDLVKYEEGKVYLENTDRYPLGHQAVFSYSYVPDNAINKNKVANYNSDKATFKLVNAKSRNLVITKATFNHQGLWSVYLKDKSSHTITLPTILLPGDSIYVVINFTPKKLNNRANAYGWRTALKFQNWIISTARKYDLQPEFGSTCSTVKSEFSLITDDTRNPIKSIALSAIWEYRSENDWEPGLQTILNALSFKTKVGFKYFDNGLKGDEVTSSSDEVAADYFQIANKDSSVIITKLASYHGCCSTADADTIEVYYPRKKNTRLLQSTDNRSGQMLLPKSVTLRSLEAGNYPTEPFAIKIGSSSTDRQRNYKNKIGIRVWKAINNLGQPLPNTFIIGSDYLGKKGTNYDYQDNVYLIENVKRYTDENIFFSNNITNIK